MNDDKKMIIPLKTLQALVDYLQTRPYQEVAALIASVVKCEPHVEPSDAPKVDAYEGTVAK